MRPDQDPDTRLYARYSAPASFGAVSISDEELGVRFEGVGDGWSVRLEPLVRDDVGNLHWYYTDAYRVKPQVPAEALGLFVAAEMRLTHDGDPDVDLDEDVAVIASMGSDHWPWPSGEAPRASGGKELSAFMQPRMKLVGAEWDWYTGHTFRGWFEGGDAVAERMSDELIRQYPPPLVGTRRDR